MEKNTRKTDKKVNFFLRWWKLGVILITIIILISFLIYITIENQNSKIKTFDESGYILQASNSQENTDINRIYFDKEQEYTENYMEQIEFEDVQGNPTTIEQDDFIHYGDGSIGVFKNAVLLNLDEIEKETIVYYTLPVNKTLLKNQDKYTVMNLNDELEFTNLILKISENKYLIASNQITLTLDNGAETKEINGYLEIEYIDNEIIKIYNQELSYQTIASNVNIQIPGDVKVDLSNKIISKANVPLLSMENMVLDSDDNIDIVDLASYEVEDAEENVEELNETENQTISEENNQSSTQNGQTSSSTNNDNSQNTNIQGNTNNTDTGLGETTGDTNFVPSVDVSSLQITEPTFKIVGFETSSVKMQAEIEIIDEQLVLTGSSTVRIIKNNTNSEVYTSEIPEGVYTSIISYENLEPDNEYTLEIKGQYKVGDITYNKTFVYKIFRTNIMGVELKKEVFTPNSLSFEMEFQQDTGVQSAVVELTDINGNYIEQKTVTQTSDKIITFNGLVNNSSYIVNIKDVIIDNVKYSNTSYTQQHVTLKQYPTISSTPEFQYDERNNQVNLKLNGISDKDKGIQSYTFMVYEEKDYGNINKKPVVEINSSTPETVITVDKEEIKDNGETVKIEGDINRNTEYYFEVIVEFYDNEKYQELTSNRSSTMKFDKLQIPTIKFNEGFDIDGNSLVTFERIQGEIQISDPANMIDDTTDSIIVNYSDGLGNKKTINSNVVAAIPIDINNLKSNTTYEFEVILMENKTDSVYLGSVYVNTKIPKDLQFSLTNNAGDLTNKFNIQVGLFNNINELELKTLNSLEVELYRANVLNNADGSKSLEKIGSAIGVAEIQDQNSDYYTSSISEDIKNNTLNIIPSSFTSTTNSSKKLTNDDIVHDQYIIEISEARDYVGNKIGLQNNKIEIYETNYLMPVGPQGDEINDALEIQEITKKQREESLLYTASLNTTTDYNSLLESTNVGFAIYPKNTYDVSTVKSITYRVYDLDSNGNPLNEIKEVTIDENTINTRIQVGQTEDEILSAYFELGNYNDANVLKRGVSYKFEYNIVLEGGEDGTLEIILPSQEQIDEGVKYFSVAGVVPKQLPDTYMYPEYLDVDSNLTLKYKVIDIDNAIIEEQNKELIMTNAGNVSRYDLNKNISIYQQLKINNILVGNLQFAIKYKLSDSSVSTEQKLIEFDYKGVLDFESVTTDIGEYDENRFEIKINGLTEEHKKSISYVSLAITKDGNTKIMGNVNVLSNNTLLVNYIELINLIGTADLTDLKIETNIYYDSSIIDFRENSNNPIIIENENGKLYKYNSGKNGLELTEVVTEATTFSIISISDTEMTLNDENGNEIKLPISITDKGIMYNNNIIYAKEIKNKTITNENIALDNSYIPMSINSVDNNKYSTLMDSYTFNFNIEGMFENGIEQAVKKDEIYIEYVKVDSSGGVIEDETWTELNISTYDSSTGKVTAEIKNLQPGTRYGVRIYNKKEGNVEYIYDSNLNKSGNIYIFATLGLVDFGNVSFRLNDGLETATLSYDILSGTTQGYDIEYILYENGEEKLKSGNPYISPTTSVNIKNSVQVNTVEGDSRIIFDTDHKYKITFLIKSKSGNLISRIDYNEEFIFNPGLPSINITTVRVDGNNMENSDILITPTLVTGQYNFVGNNLNLTVKNMNTNTKILEENTQMTTNQLSRITLDNSKGIYSNNLNYEISMRIDFDKNNDGEIDQNEYISSSSILKAIENENNIDIGEISITEHADGNLYLEFKNSLNLGEISRITYTINTQDSTEILIDSENGKTFIVDPNDPAMKYLLLESADPYPETNNKITIACFTEIPNEETADQSDTKEIMIYNSITINW